MPIFRAQGEDLVRQWLALFPKPAIEEGFADSAFGGVGAELLPVGTPSLPSSMCGFLLTSLPHPKRLF